MSDKERLRIHPWFNRASMRSNNFRGASSQRSDRSCIILIAFAFGVAFQAFLVPWVTTSGGTSSSEDFGIVQQSSPLQQELDSRVAQKGPALTYNPEESSDDDNAPEPSLPREVVSETPLHYRIRPAFRESLLQYSTMLDAVLTDSKSAWAKGFVLFKTPKVGLGNRLLSFVSTFMVAVLSGRPLVVDWADTPYGMQHLFVPTSPKLFFTFSEAAQFWPELAADEFYATTTYIDKPTWKILGCGEDWAKELPTKFVVYIDQYFIPLLSHNPHYAHFFTEWFEPFQIFPAVINSVLELRQDIRARIDGFKAAKFGLKTVGIQVRRTEGRYVTEEHEFVFWACAQSLASRWQNVNVSFFIATDNPDTRENAKRVFGDRLVFVDEPYSRRTIEGIQAAAIDMFLLGETDDLIITSFSTFGAVGAARTGIVPHLVTQQNFMCSKLLHAEPPFHYFSEKYIKMMDCMDENSPSFFDMVNRWERRP
eukprot:CAMPEP_0184663816 /NCGR_PEP_ID=MMETSP0308-20130426/49974_1 /TAXON_ID=38269 /ORGANISM="Gloeochaete witrockiana, Strain SAG 46.84" /LENGTH=479 /DNA_ID=CAMNT_0027106823 /DNA_START=46 /DNA_END=1485 /DNA_ORIENTATION=-